MFLQLWYACS